MPRRNLVFWLAMVSGSMRNGDAERRRLNGDDEVLARCSLSAEALGDGIDRRSYRAHAVDFAGG
ncbi:hypothetical protein ACP70R_009020 [Stipagrostis hirtigluma subsp. patula]